MREGDAVFPAPALHADVPALRVNGTPHAWRPGLSLADLVRHRAADEMAVATAVNGGFVGREARAATLLAPQDDVLIFGAIVGG